MRPAVGRGGAAAHIGADHRAAGARSFQPGQIDAALGGQPAGSGRGEGTGHRGGRGAGGGAAGASRSREAGRPASARGRPRRLAEQFV